MCVCICVCVFVCVYLCVCICVCVTESVCERRRDPNHVTFHKGIESNLNEVIGLFFDILNSFFFFWTENSFADAKKKPFIQCKYSVMDGKQRRRVKKLTSFQKNAYLLRPHPCWPPRGPGPPTPLLVGIILNDSGHFL